SPVTTGLTRWYADFPPAWIAGSSPAMTGEVGKARHEFWQQGRHGPKKFAAILDNIPKDFYPNSRPIPMGTRTGCAVRVDRAGARRRASQACFGRRRGT